jgi:hypothetical protein
MAFARRRLALLLTISSTAGIAVERSAFRLRPRHVESRMDRKKAALMGGLRGVHNFRRRSTASSGTRGVPSAPHRSATA